jgi:hypothetical protein
MNPWAVIDADPAEGLAGAKIAWRAAARRTHPDLGGTVEAFKEVRAAWAALREMDPPPAPEMWTHGRAVRHLVARGLVPLVDDDSRTTMFISEAGDWMADLSDTELDGVLWVLPWEDVDDEVIEQVVALLSG